MAVGRELAHEVEVAHVQRAVGRRGQRHGRQQALARARAAALRRALQRALPPVAHGRHDQPRLVLQVDVAAVAFL